MANEPVEIQEETSEPVVEDVQLEETPELETSPDENPILEEVETPPPEPEPSPPEDQNPEIIEEDENETPPEETGGDIDGEDTSTTTTDTEEPPEEIPAGEVVEVQYVVTEENYYQFNKNACVSVGDGAFHCSTNTKNELDAQSVVYAEQGASGNMEIFLKTSRGKIKQITENNFDDTAPHYDPESMRVVWQRLIDGRYQIVLYDVMEEREVQLTFSKTNNMEPKVSEAGIVWQAWDNNDWEIMLFDGTYTEQLTTNEGQDVAPVIQDGYVLWSVLGMADQEARVYSLDTKETITISGHDGGSITNPRFVLVYDTEFENGDTITQSFDPATGLSEPVAARSAPEPINIPETDPTGEIRALLLQGKNQKDESDLDTPDDSNATNTPPVQPDTLNLKVDDGIATSGVPAIVPAPFELTEYDLVIPVGAIESFE